LRFCREHGASLRHCGIAHEVKVDGPIDGAGTGGAGPAPAEAGDWSDLDAMTNADDYWEMMLPSEFARSSEALEQLASELRASAAAVRWKC
jgi:hypothetical protein